MLVFKNFSINSLQKIYDAKTLNQLTLNIDLE